MAYLSDRERPKTWLGRRKCGLCKRDGVYIASIHKPSGALVCDTCDLKAWVDDRDVAGFDAATERAQGID